MVCPILSKSINVQRSYAVYLDLHWPYRVKCVRMLIFINNNYDIYFLNIHWDQSTVLGSEYKNE